MGMDVMGRDATTEEGAYFRNNVWWWHPLWSYCEHVAPSIAGKVKHGHSNDGDGLGKTDSLRLAEVLEAELASGRTKAYETAHMARLAALPRTTCPHCAGTGVRSDAIAVQMGQPERVIDEPGHPRHGQKGWCNACDGFGTQEAFEARYPFSEENVTEFVAFLQGCGGFRIC